MTAVAADAGACSELRAALERHGGEVEFAVAVSDAQGALAPALVRVRQS